jgi:hypothetical protein
MKGLGLALAALGTLVASGAAAFVISLNWGGNPERWDKNTVTWTWATPLPSNLTNDQVLGALRSAFSAWQAVDCSRIGFSEGGQRQTDPGNGIHITFRTQSWDPTVGDALAYSSNETFRTGVIASNDVVFNAVAVTWTTTFPPPSGTNDL